MLRRILGLGLLACSVFAHADAQLQSFVESTLSAARDKAQLPAVAALIQIDGKIEADAVVGIRGVGNPRLATLVDRWHLGSCTKAMTATLVARLAERGLLSFDDTLAQVFPGIAARMNPALSNVTIAQLLNHTSGLAPLSDDAELPEFMAVIESQKGLRAQRAAVALHYLTRKPASKAGEFSYSNLGYTIVGAAAEARTGETWEELIRSEVWKPLGIRNAGFGPPGKSGKYDQPLGHSEIDGKPVALDPRDPKSDNPPAIGPAGTVNITLRDWLLFAQDQLDGERGAGKLLKPESYRKLHTPVVKNYAMGWGVLLENDGSISLITHTGSNGYWLSDVRIMPRHGMVFLVMANAGNTAAQAGVKDIGKALRDRLKPFD